MGLQIQVTLYHIKSIRGQVLSLFPSDTAHCLISVLLTVWALELSLVYIKDSACRHLCTRLSTQCWSTSLRVPAVAEEDKENEHSSGLAQNIANCSTECSSKRVQQSTELFKSKSKLSKNSITEPFKRT